MTDAEWRMCGDPEPMIRALPTERYQRELRLFAVACVRRTWDLLPESCRAAIVASERFAMGRITEPELAEAVAVADRETLAAFPGHSAPDAREYAASAAVDASSVWPRTPANVLAVTSATASAVGCAAAEADEMRYDQAFECARVAELAAQAALLRKFISGPPNRAK